MDLDISKCCKTSFLKKAFLKFWNNSLASGVKNKIVLGWNEKGLPVFVGLENLKLGPVLSIDVKVLAMALKFWINHWYKLVKPIKTWISLIDCGFGLFLIFLIRSDSIYIP